MIAFHFWLISFKIGTVISYMWSLVAYMWSFVFDLQTVLKSGMNAHAFVCVCAYFKWLGQFLGPKKGLPFFPQNNCPFSCRIHSHHVWHNLLFSTVCSRISYECSTCFGDRECSKWVCHFTFFHTHLDYVIIPYYPSVCAKYIMCLP